MVHRWVNKVCNVLAWANELYMVGDVACSSCLVLSDLPPRPGNVATPGNDTS